MKMCLRNDNEHSIMTDPVTGTPAVAEIVMDFERAAWRAADRVMPDIRCQGCAFHWGQAVWRKAQELGLRRAYLEDNATFMYVRKLMALPLLPAEHISPVFAVLERTARAEPLEALGIVFCRGAVFGKNKN